MAEVAPLIGQTVAGLELLSSLGSTRAGHLYLGQCEEGRCIVKVLRAELCGDRVRVDRWIAAARAAGALDHRGIEFVIEAGWDGEHAYLTGDIVPGHSTADLVARRALPPDNAQAIVRLAADALDAAHAAGIHHHALEPLVLYVGYASDRIQVRDFGWPLTDFGSGATFSPLASYRAPELWDGAGGAPADVYALGCIAFELISGAPPFAVDTMEAAAASHREAIPPSAREVVPDASATLDDLIARMLAKDPAKRPTMAQVRDELAGKPRTVARPIVIAPPAVATRDVASLMDAIALDANDELTPAPGPPPEPDD